MTNRTDLTEAIILRVGQLFALPVTVDDVHPDQVMFGPDGFVFGPHEFDSADLVEMVTTLEEELSIDLLELDSLDQIETVDKLAGFAIDSGPPGVIEAFTARWRGLPGAPADR